MDATLMNVNVRITNLDQINAYIEDMMRQMDDIEHKAREQQTLLADAFLPVLALQAVTSSRKISRRELFGLRWFSK